MRLPTDSTEYFRAVLISVLFIHSFICSPPALAENTGATQKATAALNAASSAAARASVAKEVALNALRNSMAILRDTEDALVIALRTGEKARAVSARQAWEKASLDVENTLDAVEEIVKQVDRSLSAYSAARDDATSASKAAKQRDIESATRNAERNALSAGKYAKNAESLAETLKKKWLIPPPPVSTPPAQSPAVDAGKK
jgi:hypothetical protein